MFKGEEKTEFYCWWKIDFCKHEQLSFSYFSWEFFWEYMKFLLELYESAKESTLCSIKYYREKFPHAIKQNLFEKSLGLEEVPLVFHENNTSAHWNTHNSMEKSKFYNPVQK